MPLLIIILLLLLLLLLLLSLLLLLLLLLSFFFLLLLLVLLVLLLQVIPVKVNHNYFTLYGASSLNVKIISSKKQMESLLTAYLYDKVTLRGCSP